MIYSREECILRSIVVGGLAATVEDELNRQGKNWAWLARETKLAPSTFVAWKNEPDRTPDLHALGLVAAKLKVSLRILIEACGFPVDDSAGYVDRQARASALVAAVPRLAEVAEDLAKLKPDDQDSLLSFIENWIRDRDRRRQDRRG
jgi:hypothetical protein